MEIREANIEEAVLITSNFLKLACVRVLQEIFAHPSVPPQYHYSPNRAERQITISRSWAERTAIQTPAIIVDAADSDMSIKQLGEEVIAWDEVTDPQTGVITQVAKIFNGVIWSTIIMEVRTKTQTDREAILSIASSYMRGPARGLFLDERVEFIDIQADETGEEEQASGQPILLGRITIKCQSEYYIRINLDLETKIKSINLGDLRFAMGAETPQPLMGS